MNQPYDIQLPSLDIEQLLDRHLESPLALVPSQIPMGVVTVVDGTPSQLVSEILRLALFGQAVRQLAEEHPHWEAGALPREADRRIRALRPHLT